MTEVESYSATLLRVATYMKMEAPECVEERRLILNRISDLEPDANWASANIELAQLAYNCRADKEEANRFIEKVLSASEAIGPQLTARAEVNKWQLCDVDREKTNDLVSAVAALEGTGDKELVDGSAMLAFIMADSSPTEARRYLETSLEAAQRIYGEISIGYARAVYRAAEFELKLGNRGEAAAGLALAEEIVGADRSERARLLLIQIERFRRKHLQ
jgi:tetratricopeptide (TPR) repeat protein